jgi:hypothetical protein
MTTKEKIARRRAKDMLSYGSRLMDANTMAAYIKEVMKSEESVRHFTGALLAMDKAEVLSGNDDVHRDFLAVASVGLPSCFTRTLRRKL